MAVRWRNGRTASLLLALASIPAVRPSGRLAAQFSFHVAAGARYTSSLVQDSIVTPVSLRPALAPALLISARHALREPWSADATLDIAPSGLRRHESGGSFEAGSVTTIAFTVGLRHDLPSRFSARAGVGALRYVGNSDGVFRDGSGGPFPLGTLSLVRSFQRVALELRYDLHRFITPALRNEGFTSGRPVHRIALLVQWPS